MDVRLLPQAVYQGSGTFAFPSVVLTGTVADTGARMLTVYGGINFYGLGTIPCYFFQGAGNNMQLNVNVAPANVIGNQAFPAWKMVMGAAQDMWRLGHSVPGSVFNEATLFSVAGSGTIYCANGIYLSNAPGAYKGSGTINARGYYKDGNPQEVGKFWADRVFSSSGSPFDYDFDTDALGNGWTITGSGGSLPVARYDLNKSWPSHLHARLSGTQSLNVVCDVGGLFAPASGSISVTAAFVWSVPNANGNAIQVELDNKGDGGSLNSIRGLAFRGTSDPVGIRMDKTQTGSATINLGSRTPYFLPRYIHVERAGTGTWGAAVSQDGMGWMPLAATQNQYFADLNRIKLSLIQIGSGTVMYGEWGLDWVKVNQLFMFS
jgi:hypothetical protein